MAVMRNISRRRFLSMAGKGLGYSALTAAVTACGGGGGGGDPVAPAPNPNPPVGTPDPDPPVASRIPPPSPEYSVLKRTSFGVNKNALEEINNLGISDYLARQLDYEDINASQIENAVANLFPLADSSPRSCALVSRTTSAKWFVIWLAPRNIVRFSVRVSSTK